MNLQVLLRKIYRNLASLRTGILLLIVVGICAAAGTFILQRPMTDPEQMERAYSPQTLRILDAVGLTDVFHTWWFLTLMALLSVSIILASIDRWPQAWRFYSRPCRRPEGHLRAALPLRREYLVKDAASGLGAARAAFKKLGWKVETVEEHGSRSLYSERFRFNVMGIFVVHFSLLLILAGGMVDGLFGFRTFATWIPGQTVSEIKVGQKVKPLGFALRCDGTGQENYVDGTPKKWWTDFTILENGKEVGKKHVIVNDPLLYKGIRFYQSSFGSSDEVQALQFAVTDGNGNRRELKAKVGDSIFLDDKSNIRIARFVPDYFLQNGEVRQKSEEIRKPALLIEVTPKDGKAAKSDWMFPAERNVFVVENSAVALTLEDIVPTPMTGLQVSYSPGQFAVWGGCVFMVLGLGMIFYFAHSRIWVVPIETAAGTKLWVGGVSAKQREQFAERFEELNTYIEQEILQGTDKKTKALVDA